MQRRRRKRLWVAQYVHDGRRRVGACAIGLGVSIAVDNSREKPEIALSSFRCQHRASTFTREFIRWPLYRAKKNVLFRTMGPL